MMDLGKPTGPEDASIYIVGEAYGADEALRKQPFIGPAGRELTKLLHESGIARTDCRISNVINARPLANNIKTLFLKHTTNERIPGPDLEAGIAALKQDILKTRPKLILAFGETALWALTGNTGIMNWRGSQLTYTDGDFTAKLIPVIHPAAILRQWSWRILALHDIRRGREWLEGQHREPEYSFLTRPNFADTLRILEDLIWRAKHEGPLRLSFDVETSAKTLQITCFGIAWSRTEALCIPITSVTSPEGYWSFAQELEILLRMRELFSLPNIQWVLQNAAYDFQWTARLWGMVPSLHLDTMLAHHVLYSGMPKSLDFLSSLYCDFHQFWKHEGKDFHTSLKTPADEDTYWLYNCKDAATTWEISTVLDDELDKANQREQSDFQHKQFWTVFRMMLRGVRINKALRNDMRLALMEALASREHWMHAAIGKVLNPRSPKQMQDFFYRELGLPVQYNRKTGRPSCDSKALAALAKREPLIQPIVDIIEEYRSGGVFLSTFINAKLDHDGRMRCSYNIAGTETFRYSSSSDAFGFGTNLQNIPKGDE